MLRTSIYNNVCQRCIDFSNMNDEDIFYHLLEISQMNGERLQTLFIKLGV